jgi:hypothetical protein
MVLDGALPSRGHRCLPGPLTLVLLALASEAQPLCLLGEYLELAQYGEALAADQQAVRWLQFARQHADSSQRMPRMPPDPELKPETLSPFLRGWSPHGPHAGWR